MASPGQMPVSGMMSARFRVLTSGLRTSYQPCSGIEPSQASTLLMLSRRGIEAHVLADLEEQPGGFVGLYCAIGGDDHLGRGVAEADLAGFGFGHRIVGVGGHPERVLVLESRSRCPSR